MSSPRIGIIGAGPAGLTLARLLQINGIPCFIFDLEQDRYARDQGGCLDLHEGAAQRALRECGLYDQFLAVARTEGEVLKIYEPNGTILLDEGSGYGERRPDSFNGRPEVDRQQLKDMLIDSLAPGTLKYGHKLFAVKTSVGGTSQKYDLHFEHSVEIGFDLVVGADGAWSKVRHLLTDQRPVYSGINGVDAKLCSIDNVDLALSRRVGQGMCLTLGSNTTVLSQRNGDGCVRSYGFMRLPEDWQTTCGIDWSSHETAKKEFIEKYYDGFNDDAKNLILLADEMAPRPMYMLPLGHRWAHRQGLTLIGDAAHLMTPFAGVGVNVAMEDALSLGLKLKQWKREVWDQSPEQGVSTIIQPTSAYEQEMFARAEAYGKETWMYLNLFFHEKGGRPMLEHFAKAKEQEREQAQKQVEEQTKKLVKTEALTQEEEPCLTQVTLVESKEEAIAQ
ncbi:FAD/NAD(P)-binding domain-containing protein [Paraphaeosphaeria sporulosa]|uniref:FAD/NAD(P)-binding domain-containing protein n=1 Tax=Paraphaeosphaeria sporulosa TaxID=1460663 RepID=A0A177CMA2_9PLEO|nr:FAD/NAD(P)-binding domain-containing protein [Paraphaeosphaeria sporulosa]OAG08643.1 FAD/NAD(P)-binding domain-containing protein [Paraphaeosphaeria sporulosa]